MTFHVTSLPCSSPREPAVACPMPSDAVTIRGGLERVRRCRYAKLQR
jgi:hypothetical protein